MDISSFLKMTGGAEYANAMSQLRTAGNEIAAAMLESVKTEYVKAWETAHATAYVDAAAAAVSPVIPAFTAPVTVIVTYDGNGNWNVLPKVDGASLTAISAQIDAALATVKLPESCGKFRLTSLGGKIVASTATTGNAKSVKADGTPRTRTATDAVWSIDGGATWVTAKHAYELLRGSAVTDTEVHNYVPDVVKFVANSETEVSVMLAGTAHPDTIKAIAGNARFIYSTERPAVALRAVDGVFPALPTA